MNEDISDFLSLRCGESPEFMKDIFREIFKAGIQSGDDELRANYYGNSPKYNREDHLSTVLYNYLGNSFTYEKILKFTSKLGL